ncbi:hypothetical protein QF049_000984 [Paenibacillus sp. W4I10]|uniref:hypothetical protein n=1 Tax=Paenibacillus sp. W4I10 TaxID=3042298 RepID=UPI00278867DC|nr:hypothetical protein [Paenibacillus sp. W4I10]MDQ0719723.1 hypothetical protein [Paenibacillus sp. W4I10]
MVLRKFVGAMLSLSLFAGVAGVQVYAESSNEGVKVEQSFTSETTFEQETVTEDTYEDFYVVPVDDLSNGYLTEDQLAESKIAWAAGVYFIPGVGEVALLATGGVIVAGATYYAGSAIYNKVKAYFSEKDAPSAEVAAEKAYQDAKKNGTKAGTHTDRRPPYKNTLDRTGKPRSSEDLYDTRVGLKQRRYYDKNGNADEDIDYDHSNADGSHTFPHRHKWINGDRF